MATDVDPLRAIARRLAPLIRKNPSFWVEGIRRWVNDPPFFGADGILPVPLQSKVTKDERIALLSAIYDSSVVEVARINPWHDPDDLPHLTVDSDNSTLSDYRLAIRYEILLHHRVPKLREHWDTHEEAIVKFLAEAAEALAGSPSPESSADIDDVDRTAAVQTGTPVVSQSGPGTMALNQTAGNNIVTPAIWRLLRALTNGLADSRIKQAVCVLDDDKLTVNEKLAKISTLLPFPATASAEQLGQMLGVSKQAVHKSEWWTQTRKGEKANEIGRREVQYKMRAEIAGRREGNRLTPG